MKRRHPNLPRIPSKLQPCSSSHHPLTPNHFISAFSLPSLSKHTPLLRNRIRVFTSRSPPWKNSLFQLTRLRIYPLPPNRTSFPSTTSKIPQFSSHPASPASRITSPTDSNQLTASLDSQSDEHPKPLLPASSSFGTESNHISLIHGQVHAFLFPALKKSIIFIFFRFHGISPIWIDFIAHESNPSQLQPRSQLISPVSRSIRS